MALRDILCFENDSMRTIFTSLALVAPLVDASASYLAGMADSFIKRGVPKDFHYDHAVLYSAFQAAYSLTGNATLLNWLHSQIDDAVVLPDGNIAGWDYSFYSLDDYRIGNNFLWLYNMTGEEKYRQAAEIPRNQLNRHPRTPTGGFWHREPAYPNQMWLDGIFMADSFYARWTATFDESNSTAWDDILSQYEHIEQHCRNQTTGLLVHGYDESKQAVWADPITGAAPLVWDRAVGWYFMSLMEAIEVWPEWHPGREKLTAWFQSLAQALKMAWQQDGPGWWLIMTEGYPGKEGNYVESSASAMFTFGFLKGIRQGLLEESEYSGLANEAYEFLADRFVEVNETNGLLDWKGTVIVGSLGSNGTFEVRWTLCTKIRSINGGAVLHQSACQPERCQRRRTFHAGFPRARAARLVD